MSKFKDQIDSCMIICPYCHVSWQMEGEDYDHFVDGAVETCHECEKKFAVELYFDTTITSRPSCELNGEEHVLRESTQPNYQICSVCDRLAAKKK